MPTLDFAFLADPVRVEPVGVAHVISAGINTIWAAEVPAGQNLALVMRIEFTRQECGRPHRIEVVFQDEDGQVLSKITAVEVPGWNPDLPVHWPAAVVVGLNFGVPLPRYGFYSLEIMINDESRKTLSLRVIPLGAEQTPELPAS